jgi:hypothetical protein
MAIRLTQQVRLTAFAADPTVRVTSVATEVIHKPNANVRTTALAVEVLRSLGEAPLNIPRPMQFIMCTG